MKTNHAYLLILILCFSLPVLAQENREPTHECFRLNQERVVRLKLVNQAPGPELFQTGFIGRHEWAGKQVFVRLPAMDIPYSIRINGFRFGSDPGSRFTAEYNLSPFLKEHANTLQLELDLSGQEEGFVPSQKSVSAALLIRNAIHVRDLVTTCYPGAEENKRLVRFHLFIKSYLSEKSLGRSIELLVESSEGEAIFNETRNLESHLAYGQETELIVDMSLENPHFWIPGSPDLYGIQVSLKESGDALSEVVTSNFSIREFQVADSVLIFHGDTSKLRFAPNSFQLALPELSDKEIIQSLSSKEFNAIKLATPLPCETTRLLDQYGILILPDQE